jgi:DNA polymerase V
VQIQFARAKPEAGDSHREYLSNPDLILITDESSIPDKKNSDTDCPILIIDAIIKILFPQKIKAMPSQKHAHGGPRRGAGRPRGTGRLPADEALTQLRIPLTDKPAVLSLLAARRVLRQAEAWQAEATPPEQETPLFSSKVAAGFPSPADDYLEARLDLNRYLIKDAPATFMVRVKGDSMTGAGIGDGDILVVEKGRSAQHQQIVLAVVDSEFTVKRLFNRDGRLALIPENPAYPPIEIDARQELTIWGVVTACIKKF